MNKNFWFFQAINFLLLANLFLGDHKGLGLFFCLFWIIRINKLDDKKVFIYTCFCSCFFCLFILQSQFHNKTELKGDEDQFLMSLVRSSLKIDGDYLSFTGKIEQNKNKIKSEKIVVHYYIETEEEKERWLKLSPNVSLIVEGDLEKPSKQTNFNQFDYRNYLERNKIHWQLKAKKIKLIPSVNNKKRISKIIDNFRFHIIRYIDINFHEKVASYLKILFMADSLALSYRVKKGYRAIGLIHFFSISGFHISYFTRVLERFFLRLGVSRERTRYILVAILPFYGLLAGLTISVFRSIAQKVIKTWSIILHKDLDNIDIWAIAMILTLVMNPYSIFELSFQLSYGLSGMFIITREIDWIKKLSLFKQNIFYTSSITILTLPFLSYHFFEISWISIVSNLLFLPIFSYFLFPLFFILFLASVFLSQSFIFIRLDKIVAFILIKIEFYLLRLTEKFTFSFVIGRLPYIILVFLFLIIIYCFKKIEKRETPSTFLLLAFFLCIMWNKLSPLGYVIILDVGQGDSILIKEPLTGKISLIDTGGRLEWQDKEDWQKRDKEFTIGEDIVVASLKSLGVSKIDRLYISHAHFDHMGEIKNISKHIKIKEIAVDGQTLKDQSFQKQLVGIKQSKLVEVQAKTRINYPTANTLILHPINNYNDKNNQSLVLYVKIGEDYWLFTGDLEKEGEKDLIKVFPSLKVDYLKAGHHGSSTSSTINFIDSIQPKIAFISAGEKNNYDHPSIEVLNYFSEQKIETYLTAKDGAVKVSYFKIPLLNKWITKIDKVNKD